MVYCIKIPTSLASIIPYITLNNVSGPWSRSESRSSHKYFVVMYKIHLVS